ncbi:hypothetical protein PSHT_12106 [Puccinia striiformis]|uniref:Uncharacterized protein n=1 Tax=Puccinia striiformis TaxID=27350 RepID=A0A2S4UYX8_9BASI|nr:hypothetical protein PSHT_12106 [Puccinia striiformis]
MTQRNIYSSINCCRITQTHRLANQNMYVILNSKIRLAELISIFLRPRSSSADSHGYRFLSIVVLALQPKDNIKSSNIQGERWGNHQAGGTRPKSLKDCEIVTLRQQLFSVKRKLNFFHDKTPRLSLVQTLSYHSNSPWTKPKHVRHSQLKGVVGLANHELLSWLEWTAFSLDLDVASSIVDRDAETTKPETCAASPGHQILGKMANKRRTMNSQPATAVANGETVVLKEVDFQLIFSVSKKYQQPITTASVKESIPDVTKSLTKTYKPSWISCRDFTPRLGSLRRPLCSTLVLEYLL